MHLCFVCPFLLYSECYHHPLLYTTTHRTVSVFYAYMRIIMCMHALVVAVYLRARACFSCAWRARRRCRSFYIYMMPCHRMIIIRVPARPNGMRSICMCRARSAQYNRKWVYIKNLLPATKTLTHTQTSRRFSLSYIIYG